MEECLRGEGDKMGNSFHCKQFSMYVFHHVKIDKNNFNFSLMIISWHQNTSLIIFNRWFYHFKKALINTRERGWYRLRLNRHLSQSQTFSENPLEQTKKAVESFEHLLIRYSILRNCRRVIADFFMFSFFRNTCWNIYRWN